MNDIPSLKYSKELSTSIEDDARRRAIDAAKKRAVAQNVDYPTFAALVSVAHLKPFQRQKVVIEPPQSTTGSSTTAAWHFDASGNLEKLKDNASEDLRRPGRKMAVLTCDAFRRDWKLLSGSDFPERLAFLLSIWPQDLPLIFKVEVPPLILADIVEVLSSWKSFRSSNDENMHPLPIFEAFRYDLALEMMYYLTKCGRFSLSLRLIGPKAQNMVAGLLNEGIGQSLPGSCFKESGMKICDLLQHLRLLYGLNK